MALSATAVPSTPPHSVHGSRDTVFAVDRQEAFCAAIRKTGTPIRMVDWREAIGWMMGRRLGVSWRWKRTTATQS